MLAALLVPGARPGYAQKIDVVEMDNGDRVTCEIKSLSRGILEAKTDSWGTIEIEWTEIAQVESPARFDVQLRSGERLTSSLGRGAANGRITLDGRDLAIADVIAIAPLKETFWEQLDGGLDVGYSFATAGSSTQLTVSADVRRHSEATDVRVSGDSLFASKEGAEDTSRHSFSVDWTRYLRANWGVVLLGQAQRNDELNLQLRAQAGAGVVHRFMQSNSGVVAAYGGATFSNEVFTDDTPSERTWELVLVTQAEYFIFNSPKTRISATFGVFPNVTTWGRVRSELNASLRREIVKDLTVSLSVLDSYDSDPPSQDARHHDLAIVTSFGWTF